MAGRPIRFSILADDKDFANAVKSVDSGFDKMSSSAETAGNKIDASFDGTAEGADTLASKGAQAAGALSGLGDVVGGPIGAGMQGLGVGMQAAADAGDLLNVAIEGGKSALTAMGSGLASVGKALKLDKIAKATATAVQWAWNAAMSANPLGLIVIAIAAVVAGLVLFFTKTKTGKAIITGAFAAFKTSVKAVSDFFTNTFVPAVKAVWTSVSTWFGKVVSFVTGLPGKISRGASGIWHGITGGLSAIVGSYSSGSGGIKGYAYKAVSFVAGLPSKIASAARGLWDGISDSFRGMLNTIIGWWNNFSITLSVPSNALTNAIGLGGKGFRLDTPNIPFLAKGGITTGPTLAVLGDNPGGREAVIPLDRAGGILGQTVNVTIRVEATPGVDKVALGRDLANSIGEFVRSGGAAPVGLIYELTAASYDATEAAKWSSNGYGATMTASGGRLRLIADAGSVDGALEREPIDAPSGRYVLVVEVDQPTPAGQSGSCAAEASFFLSTPTIRSGTAERYVIAGNLDTDSNPITPAFRYLTMSSGTAWPVYIDRLAIYSVESRHLLDQLEVQVLTPGEDGFRLNTDTLGDGRLGNRATATAWTDYLPDATGLTIDRGADVDGVETTTQVGTATLTVKADTGAAPGLGLRPNLPIRIRSKLTGTVAYTGAVGDLTDTWRKPTGPGPMPFFASIPCVDAVRDLAGISRNGALGIDRWADRVRRIMASYPGPWSFAPGTDPNTYWPVCARTVYESTLDKHLQLVTNTSAGRWYVDRDNVIRVEVSNWSSQERPIRLRFSDGSDGLDPDDNPLIRHYTDLVRTYDTRALVNDLSFANHDATLNDQGEWVAADSNLGPFQNATSAASYGVRHADIDTCLETGPGDPDNDAVPDTDPVGELVAEYTRDNTRPAVRFSQLTYDATNDVDVACSLDVFDLVLVTNAEITDQQNRIIGIRHDITSTPERWLVTLTLQAWSVS